MPNSASIHSHRVTIVIYFYWSTMWFTDTKGLLYTSRIEWKLAFDSARALELGFALKCGDLNTLNPQKPKFLFLKYKYSSASFFGDVDIGIHVT